MRGEGSVKKTVVRRGAWTPEEDTKLKNYIDRYGIWNWVYIPKYAGLTRSGKSCRLRWMNYLNPKVKRGNYSPEEDEVIINMRQKGAGWAAIAEKLPGRTDNEIKNRWCAHLKKRGLSNPTNESVEEPEIQIDDLELRLGLPGCSENRISEGPTVKG